MTKRALVAGIMCIMTAAVISPAIAENEYWDNGNIRVSCEYDGNGELSSKTYYNYDGDKEKQEKFNTVGEKISLAHYDRHGKLKSTADGWACMMWKYDNGNMIGEGYYGEDGKLIEYKRYSSEGDLVDKKYFGGKDPDPDEEYGTVPTLAGENMEYYDEYGKEEGSTGVSYDEPFFPYFFYEDGYLEREELILE